jgi:VanZ family protein
MTAFVACMDEYHQTFIPSRTGTIRDVMLDSTAALVAQIILFIALRKRNRDVPIARAHGAS